MLFCHYRQFCHTPYYATQTFLYCAASILIRLFPKKYRKKLCPPMLKVKVAKTQGGAKSCRTIYIMSNCQALPPPTLLGALPERAFTQGAGRGASLAIFAPFAPLLSILGGFLFSFGFLLAWGLAGRFIYKLCTLHFKRLAGRRGAFNISNTF